jgi:signal transduction histidine kinase
MPTLLSNIFASATRGEPVTGLGGLHLPAPNVAAYVENASREPLLNLSLPGHLQLPVVVFATSFLSIEFSHTANFVGTLWVSNAIILVALLRHVRSLSNYGSILLGGAVAMALAAMAAGSSPALAAIASGANIGEAAVAFALLSLFRIDAFNLTSFKNLLIFIGLAGVVAPLGSAILGASAFGPPHGLPWQAVWRNWYAGHALGMIIATPFLISITSREWRRVHIEERLPETAAFVALSIAIGLGAAYFRPLVFVSAPVILIATVRFGLVGATLATFFTAIITSWFVVTGVGQPLLAQTGMADRVFGLQAFLALTSFWSLPTAALLTERDRLLTDLSRANAQLMAESERIAHLVIGLRHHLSMAEEKERLRLSHELHDQAGQSLIAAILELNEIDSLIDGPARARLHLVRKRMEDMGKTLHRIAWELRPPAIDELGLRKALSSYIADWSEQCGADVDFHCDDPRLDEVPNEIGTAIYRIVQEGLTNIVKHAQRPSNVSIVIWRPDATLQVIIEDNGCGFDVGATAAKPGAQRGLGLDGMRERLSLIGGTLEIESAIGGGTTIFARITLDGQRSAT